MAEARTFVWQGDLQLDFELLSEDLVEPEVHELVLIAGFDGCPINLDPRSWYGA